ncbi:MAG: dihydroneopterin aldolase [Pseudomonadota bacterium]
MKITPLPRTDSAPRRTVFVRDLQLDAFIGAYESEQGAAQPIIIDIDIDVVDSGAPDADRIDDVLCYNKLTQGVKAILAEGHIKLVETLAERIAGLALANPLAVGVTVRVQKPRAIAEAAAAGVQITRAKR